MAAKKESIYKNWDDVDLALKELGELNIQKDKLEGRQTKLINAVKGRTAQRAKGVVEKIKAIEKNIEIFAKENKDEFAIKRSKRMNFGTISFKRTKRIVCSCVDAAIRTLEKLQLTQYIRIKKELDKEALKEADVSVLTKIQAELKHEDKLNIEPDYVKICENEEN